MSYPATPLCGADSFRVMNLQPGQASDPIRFTLDIISWSSEESGVCYEAVSYTWGNVQEQQDIFCTNAPSAGPAPLCVTQNCFKALKNLRHNEQSRTIWLDAVCIDQSNVAERSTQVQIMGSIYAGARRVIVYLGEANNNSALVIQWLEYNYSLADYPRREITVSKPSGDDFTEFTNRPWFFRTWVLQEVVNATKLLIQCGTLTLAWEAFRDHFDRTHPTTPILELLTHVNLLRQTHDTNAAQFLLSILQATRPCLASNPRDRIHGILPLLQELDVPEALKPDYSMQASAVFTRVANHLYSQLGPSLLRHTVETRSATLPSWVPEWSRVPDWPVAFKLKTQDRKLAAGGTYMQDRNSMSENTRSLDPNQLCVKGIFLGSITEIGPACDNAQIGRDEAEWSDDDETFNPLLEWRKLAGVPAWTWEGIDLVKDPSSRSSAFYRLVSQDTVGSAGNLWQVGHVYHRLCRGSPFFMSPELFIVERILESCGYRKFALIGPVTMALIPAAAEIGDEMEVIAGSPLPHLLRKKGDAYTLIG